MKKVLSILLMLVLMLSMVACAPATPEVSQSPGSGTDEAATGSSGEAEAVNLSILAIPAYEEYINTAFEAFKQSDPMYANYTMTIESVPFAQLFETIEVKVSQGDSTYDILFVDGPVVSAYGLRGYLSPLDDYFTAEELALFEESTLVTSYYDNNLLAPPIDASGLIMYYNKDLLDEAGIPYPSTNPDERLTWEQIEEYGKQFMDAVNPNRDNSKYAFVQHQVSRPYEVLPMINSLGGKSMGDDGVSAEGVVNSQEWKDAMTFYQNMFNEYEYSPKGIEAPATVDWFAAGNVAFLTSLVQYAGQFEEAGINYGYTYYPYFESGEVAQANDNWHLGINAFSEQPDKAIPFLKFMTIGEGAAIKSDVMGGVSQLKSEMDNIIAGSDTVMSEMATIIQHDYQYAVPRPSMEGYREYEIVLTETFEDIRSARRCSGQTGERA